MNKDINDLENLEEGLSNINTNIKKDKYKFKRSAVIYNFIDFIVKRIYLINDHLVDVKTE